MKNIRLFRISHLKKNKNFFVFINNVVTLKKKVLLIIYYIYILLSYDKNSRGHQGQISFLRSTYIIISYLLLSSFYFLIKQVNYKELI